MTGKEIYFYLEISSPDLSFRANIEKEVVSVGNSDMCDIVIPDGSLAPVHFHLRRKQQTYEVVSLANETLLNGMPVRIEALRDGDSLAAGSTKLTFHISGEVELLPLEAPPLSAKAEPPQEPSLEETYALREEVSPDPAKEAAPCPACGNEIQLGDQFCRFCGAPLGEKALEKARKESGDWSVLGPSGAVTPGLKFQVLLDWIENGRLNRYSTVKGPTTGYKWKSACEAPALSKYFGVCYRCNAGVEREWDFCRYCGADLDGKGRVAPGGKQETYELEKEKTRKSKTSRPQRRLGLAAKIVVGLCLLAIAISALRLGLWSRFAPRSWQSAVSSASDRFIHALKMKIGPERFPGERHRLDRARALLQRESYDAAISASEAIISDFPGTQFARMAEEVRARAQEGRQKMLIRREIHGLLEKGKNFALNQMYAEALETYRSILSKYPDHPMSEEARQKIKEILTLLKASDNPPE